MSNIEKLLSFLFEEEIKTPRFGYHVTLLERLPKIMKQGLQLPSNSVRKRTLGENWIYLFTHPSQANKIAQHISLPREKDWVLLKISRLQQKFLMPDDDYGDTWQESLKNANTFAYADSIAPSQIKVIAKAINTKEEYHDEFEFLS